MAFTDPIVGGTTLIRTAIRSPNYAAGTAGWTINRDGSAEFNQITSRGTVIVGTAPGQVILDENAGNGRLSATGIDGTKLVVDTGLTAGISMTPALSGHSYQEASIEAFVNGAGTHHPVTLMTSPCDQANPGWTSAIVLSGASATSTLCTIQMATQNDSPPNSGAMVNSISILPATGSTVITTNGSGDATISTPYTTLWAFMVMNGDVQNYTIVNNRTGFPNFPGNTVGLRVFQADTGAPHVGNTRFDWIAWGIV